MENINLTLEQLKNLMTKYDLTNGEWPVLKSRWQGSSVYHFILEELGIKYDVVAKSFDKLVRKTGNKKTKKIAAKRTQELLEEYCLAEKSELINNLKNTFLGPQPTKDGSITYWGTDQLDEEVEDLIQRMTLNQKLWLLSACGVISMENE